MERLSQLAKQATSPTLSAPLNPLDPLSAQEVKAVTDIVKAYYGGRSISFNTVTLREPTKNSYVNWSEKGGAMPPRYVYFVVLEENVDGLQEGVVDLNSGAITELHKTVGLQPILTVEDMQNTEAIIRSDPKVIEQCVISGVPASDMHKIFCDPWAIGYDERWGAGKRLQQALIYYRADEDDSHYSHPLDFCPIVDFEKKEVIFIDIPNKRRPLSKHPHANFYPKHTIAKYGKMRTDGKPINITQPEGVSFKMTGNVMEWSNFKFHIGFNYREGIVLSDISYNDHGNQRPIFHRMSLSEMIVPYGAPEFPHHRKHALDIGEYGAGSMTNSLSLGCDCKGVIHYLDAVFADRAGEPITIKNAVCIHEEDDGLLYKHSDFRDGFATSIASRATKLIISQIFTASNYEYCIYWTFLQDGSMKLDIRLTGILNTYVLAEGEDTGPYGTQVYPQVNAHNHQHLFGLRIHPRIDGDNNSVAMCDAMTSPYPIGHKENMYGNGFYSKKTTFKKVKESLTNYESSTGRSWDLFNPSKINTYSGKPASYKLVSSMCPPLLAKEGSLPAKRAPWAKNTVSVVPYEEGRLYPSGQHPCQWSGDGMYGIRDWIGDGEANIENTEVVMFHTFGITHFPAPEDFPVMPAEPITVLLRPRHFFLENPTLDIVPTHAMTTSEARTGAVKEQKDKHSRLAFGKGDSCSSCS